MSRIRLVARLIVFLVFSDWVRFIDCDQNVTNATAVNGTDPQQPAASELSIERRSGNIILDGIQYLPECGLLCKLHRLTSHLPPVMINFNHQYQHYVPVEPIPIPLHHEMHHSDLHAEGLHQHELRHPELHHPELHHELHHPELHHVELHHPELHHTELHHPELHSGLGLHHKLLPEHQFGLPMHPIHPHLGLSSSFHQTAAISPAQPVVPPPQPMNGHQLQTSASTVTHRNNEENLDAIQKMFTGYESKYPVSIVEEHFPLPQNYGPLGGPIETHQSSVRPLFIPEKSELKPGLPPYEVEDSRSTIIDYQPFPPRFPPDHHFGDSPPPPYHHHPPPPPSAFLHPPQHHGPMYPPNGFLDKEPIPIYPTSKPNIEILKLNEQDYPLPPHRPSNATAYENLIADLHARIKDPTTYYQHPEPEKGSIVYADAELERRRPPVSKIDENSVLNIGQNYGRVKHIQEQLNSMKRQFPEEEPPPVNYHHRIHHHEMSNSHFGNMEPAMHHVHRPHIESHHYNPPHLVEHYQPPIVIEEPPHAPPMHLGHQQSFSLPGPQPKSFKKPTMEFNGFYSNFYSQLPPAPPPHYSHYGK